MLTAFVLLLQTSPVPSGEERVELKEFKAFYRLMRPAAYSDHVSWPAMIDLGDERDPLREPEGFVVAPEGRRDEAFVLACLTDVKTRFRVSPERVAVRGGGAALELAAAHPDLFAACAVQHARAFVPLKKAPPCTFFVARSDPDRAKVVVAAMIMKNTGVEVEVREAAERPGAIFAALAPRIRAAASLPKADDLQRSGRILDASLMCIDLLDNPEVERLARTKLKSIEGAAIIELAKVEISMADRKYKDAVLRCREAARQFAWVPTGEKIRKRLGELELRPEVKRALETED